MAQRGILPDALPDALRRRGPSGPARLIGEAAGRREAVKPCYLDGMATALASVGFVVVFVVAAGAVLGVLHRALRAREIHARSATALRELEPRGGRHRFHTRLFEVIALASACTPALGVLLLFAATPDAPRTLGVVGGGSLLVAVWWAWRRGTLRAVEAEPTQATDAELRAGHIFGEPGRG